MFFIVYIGLDWFGGVFGKRENVGFSKKMLLKFCQDPCSCFSYRLSYNHPNEVILIGKKTISDRSTNLCKGLGANCSFKAPKYGLKGELG